MTTLPLPGLLSLMDRAQELDATRPEISPELQVDALRAAFDAEGRQVSDQALWAAVQERQTDPAPGRTTLSTTHPTPKTSWWPHEPVATMCAQVLCMVMGSLLGWLLFVGGMSLHRAYAEHQERLQAEAERAQMDRARQNAMEAWTRMIPTYDDLEAMNQARLEAAQSRDNVRKAQADLDDAKRHLHLAKFGLAVSKGFVDGYGEAIKQSSASTD